jgi:hypothetical protein
VRRILLVVLAALPLAPAVAGEPPPGYFMSPNVHHVAHIPLNNDSAGARILGDHLYITTSRDLKIYDVSSPESPREVGSLLLPQMPYFAEEDVDTNGRILLVDGPNGPAATLNVIDVEDETNPRVIGTLEGLDQHTFSCVLDCRWAYGSRGAVVDLRDPAHPDLAGDWRTRTPLGNGAAHDVTEVAPGLVVTSSRPMMLLDARRDPRRPSVLALGDHPFEQGFGNFWLVHGNEWPRRGRDAFLLTSGEGAGPSCDDGAAAFLVWDATRWRATRSFEVVGEYRPRSGLPTEGNAPADLLCSHWFDAHPAFRDGGLVAIGWYDHGVRFLDVSPRGDVEEVGYFMAAGGSMSAAYWADDEIVYAVDYHRGLDILRFTGARP